MDFWYVVLLVYRLDIVHGRQDFELLHIGGLLDSLNDGLLDDYTTCPSLDSSWTFLLIRMSICVSASVLALVGFKPVDLDVSVYFVEHFLKVLVGKLVRVLSRGFILDCLPRYNF